MTGLSQGGNISVDTRNVFAEFLLFSKAEIYDYSQYAFKQRFANGDYAQFNPAEDGYVFDGSDTPSYPSGTTTQVLIYQKNGGSYSFSQLEMTPADVARYASMSSLRIAAEFLSDDDALYGSQRKDWLDGYRGADDLYGDGGSDTYVVDNRRDEVFEADLRGDIDKIIATTSYSIGEGLDKFIEQLEAFGPGARRIDLTGNDFSNTIYGHAGANRLDGGGGQDSIWGRGGRDTFVFGDPPGGGVDGRSELDTIRDFSSRFDQIALSRADFRAFFGPSLSEREFHSVTSLAQVQRDDRIIYNERTGYLYADEDGSGDAEAALIGRFLLNNRPADILYRDFEV